MSVFGKGLASSGLSLVTEYGLVILWGSGNWPPFSNWRAEWTHSKNVCCTG